MDANLVMVVVPITRSLWRIDNLIGIEDEDNTAQDTRFANYLRQLFPSDVPTMTVAARALGMNKKKKKKKERKRHNRVLCCHQSPVNAWALD